MCKAMATYRILVRQGVEVMVGVTIPGRAVRRACPEHLTKVIDLVFAEIGRPVVVTSTSEWTECGWILE